MTRSIDDFTGSTLIVGRGEVQNSKNPNDRKAGTLDHTELHPSQFHFTVDIDEGHDSRCNNDE